MNKISITIESIEKYKVIASYKTEGIVGTYINQNEIPFLEFQTDISEVPKSVLVIPFLANILPIAWIFNSIIDTPEVDKIFLNNLDKTKMVTKICTLDLNGSIQTSLLNPLTTLISRQKLIPDYFLAVVLMLGLHS